MIDDFYLLAYMSTGSLDFKREVTQKEKLNGTRDGSLSIIFYAQLLRQYCSLLFIITTTPPGRASSNKNSFAIHFIRTVSTIMT